VLQTSKLITTTPFVLLGERSSPSTGAPIVAAALALPALSLVPCRGPADPARDAGAVAAAATADAVGAAAGGQRVDTIGTGAVSARAGAAFAASANRGRGCGDRAAAVVAGVAVVSFTPGLSLAPTATTRGDQ